jgi:hypothetical protein
MPPVRLLQRRPPSTAHQLDGSVRRRSIHWMVPPMLGSIIAPA